MQITAEEKLMYGVMKAIYDSGIPIDFKGSMVLPFFDSPRYTVSYIKNRDSILLRHLLYRYYQSNL